MPRLYIRIESAKGPKDSPTPGEEAACLRAAAAIAAALGVEQQGSPKAAKHGTLRGVTLRLDIDG